MAKVIIMDTTISMCPPQDVPSIISRGVVKHFIGETESDDFAYLVIDEPDQEPEEYLEDNKQEEHF